MPYGTPPRAQQLLEHGRFNRFLAKRGVMLHDVGEEIEQVYFPHSGMVFRSWRSCKAGDGRNGSHRTLWCDWRERRPRAPLDIRAGHRGIAGHIRPVLGRSISYGR